VTAALVPGPGRAAPRIPLVLVRLKLRLARNNVVRTRGGRVGLVLGSTFGVIGAIVGFAIVAGSAGNDDPLIGRAVLVVGATVMFVAWVTFPLLTFGTDETLDPARLQLFPLARRPLMIGLLLCSLVGFAPAAASVTAAGAVAGYGRGLGLPIVVLDAVTLVLLCAAAARALSTALASRLSSRRGRDAIIVVASLLAVGFQALRFVRFGSIGRDLVETLVAVLRWTPPGMLGQSVADAHRGRLVVAVAEWAVPFALLPPLVRSWARSLDRSLTVVAGGSATPRRQRTHRTSLRLLFDRLPLPATAMGGVAAKELRYVVRHPRLRVVLTNSVVFGIGGPIFLGVRAGASLGPGSTLLASAAGYLAIFGGFNQFGVDGGALWTDAVSGVSPRAVLMGKNLASAIVALPIVTIAAIVLAAFSGGWIYIPGSVVLALAGLGAGLAVADVASVRFGLPLPERASPFARGGAGQGCTIALVLQLCLLVQLLLMVPIGIGGLVGGFGGSLWMLAVTPLCLAYGYAVWRGGLGMAARYATTHGPELLAAVHPRQSV
jgi:ABC-2 type transport system permease protein